MVQHLLNLDSNDDDVVLEDENECDDPVIQ